MKKSTKVSRAAKKVVLAIRELRCAQQKAKARKKKSCTYGGYTGGERREYYGIPSTPAEVTPTPPVQMKPIEVPRRPTEEELIREELYQQAQREEDNKRRERYRRLDEEYAYQLDHLRRMERNGGDPYGG